MRRVIAIACAGMSLAGCSSFSLDMFKSTPPGADAKTSLGPGCKTPCSVSVPAPDSGFSVTFTMDKFQPATVPVQVIRTSGDITSPARVVTDPSPVSAELQPAAPPPRGVKRMRPKRAKKPAAAPAAAAPADAGSPAASTH